MAKWHDLGPADRFTQPATPVAAGRTRLAVTNLGGRFGVISGTCSHAGGPLGEGRLDREYVKCPWHGWKYHAATGKGEPGFEADAVPAYAVRVEGGRLLVDLASATPWTRAPHAPHPLARRIAREKGSRELREGAQMLAARAVHAAQLRLEHEAAPHAVALGGRKAHHLVLEELGAAGGEGAGEGEGSAGG
jgi:nitrite reductase/ring-hydroxylating ferredoxin subunit